MMCDRDEDLSPVEIETTVTKVRLGRNTGVIDLFEWKKRGLDSIDCLDSHVFVCLSSIYNVNWPLLDF
jgi:hypothetical protein